MSLCVPRVLTLTLTLSLYAHYILTLLGRCLPPNVQLYAHNRTPTLFTPHTQTLSPLSMLRTPLSSALNNSPTTTQPSGPPERGGRPGQRHTPPPWSSGQGAPGPRLLSLSSGACLGGKRSPFSCANVSQLPAITGSSGEPGPGTHAE